MPRAGARSTITRHPERNSPEEFDRIMTAGPVVHVSFCVGDQPHIIPVTYQYDASEPDVVYLHGAKESRLQQVLAAGTPVCLCVTIVDGYVYSRTAMNHSMNYRCAISFGRGTEVTDTATKRRVFEAMTSRIFPDRTAGVDYQPATDAQLDSLTMVAVRLEEGSAKIRTGGARGPGDDSPEGFGSCGVVPTR